MVIIRNNIVLFFRDFFYEIPSTRLISSILYNKKWRRIWKLGGKQKEGRDILTNSKNWTFLTWIIQIKIASWPELKKWEETQKTQKTCKFFKVNGGEEDDAFLALFEMFVKASWFHGQIGRLALPTFSVIATNFHSLILALRGLCGGMLGGIFLL